MKSVIAVLLFGYAAAFLHPTSWNGLEVTFGFNPFSSWNFNTMPRTTADAVKADFKMVDSQCTDANQTFRGMRYQYKDDANVLVLFDKNGYIAGIQARGLASDFTPSEWQQSGPYSKDGDYWTLTTYFVDPSIICDPGRTAAQFEAQGTGTALYIQNGTKPAEVMKIPNNEDDIKTTDWGNGKCFVMMGKHYWFNVRKDMPEGEFFPYCILYNGGKLDAFCYALDVDIQSSNRMEHPDPTAANTCCINAPDFFYTQKNKQTTLHVYMTDSPKTSFC